MAWSNVTRSFYTYQTDKGATFRVRYDDSIWSQTNAASNHKVGGALATTEEKYPSGGKLRRAVLRDTIAKKDRMVGILEQHADLIAVPKTGTATDYQLTLNYASTGANATFTYQGLYLTETRARR